MSKVLFVASEVFSTGGIQRFNHNLLDAWSDLNVDLTVLSLADRKIPTNAVEDYPGFKIIVCNGNKFLFSLRLLFFCINNRFDKLVCGHINMSPVFIPLVFITGGLNRTVLIMHGIDIWGRVTGILKKSSKHFTQVLAVSSYTLQEFFKQNSSVNISCGHVFPNTINRESKPVTLKETEDNNDVISLISVSRLATTEREKGIYDVIDALELMSKLNLEYTVVGDGDDKANIIAYAKQKGVSNKLRLTGRLLDEELWAAYKKADIFILPSKKEGFGIVFIEAMQFSLPVIAASEKGALDVIEHDKTGLLVKYGNKEDIADSIKRLADDIILRKQLVSNANELIMPGGKFSFEAFRERTKIHLC